MAYRQAYVDICNEADILLAVRYFPFPLLTLSVLTKSYSFDRRNSTSLSRVVRSSRLLSPPPSCFD